MFTSTTIDLETFNKSIYTMLHSFYIYRYVVHCVNVPLNTEHVLHTFGTYSQFHFQNRIESLWIRKYR